MLVARSHYTASYPRSSAVYSSHRHEILKSELDPTYKNLGSSCDAAYSSLICMYAVYSVFSWCCEFETEYEENLTSAYALGQLYDRRETVDFCWQ